MGKWSRSVSLDLWRPLVALCGLVGFVLAFALPVAVAVALLGWGLSAGGCAVGYPVKADGTADLSNPSIGVGVGSVNQAAAGALSLGGLMSGNPAVVGLAALVAHQFGSRKGWDEKEADTLKARGIVATTEKA